MSRGFPPHWQRRTALSLALLPVAWLFSLAAAVRRAFYRAGFLPSRRLPVPVIVIGNRVVGGTGKTPLVLALVEKLREAGLRPGIVSRGHGGRRTQPGPVRSGDDPGEVGDEALLLAGRSGSPVWTGRDRAAAGRALLAHHAEVDLLVCDDGLQHYGLARDLEVAVEDPRGHGNGLPLPAGPMREPASRRVDAIVINGEPHPARAPQLGNERVFRMALEADGFYALDTGADSDVGELRARRLHAVAGIGHPDRFFTQLEALGLRFTPHAFPDHHPYSARDLAFEGAQAIVMTEKDAVKCARLNVPGCYAFRVRAHLDPAFFEFVLQRLRALRRGP